MILSRQQKKKKKKSMFDEEQTKQIRRLELYQLSSN